MARSAGMLLYRIDDGVLYVLLARLGGPLWARRDERAWSMFALEADFDWTGC